MRLTSKEISIIKKVIKEYICDAKIILFGSRVYDTKKGGDIDILIVTKEDVSFEKKLDILTQIELNGIERKVDILIKTPFTKETSIIKTAIKEGIGL
jgi:predicted nucleotidyltransferase